MNHPSQPVKPLVPHRRPFSDQFTVGVNLMPFDPLPQPDRFLNPHHVKPQPLICCLDFKPMLVIFLPWSPESP